MSVTHIASRHVTIEGRTVQRCGWCGTKLLDSQGAMCAVPVEFDSSSDDGRMPVWPEGAFVQVDGNRSSVIETDEANLLPEDNCRGLVE